MLVQRLFVTQKKALAQKAAYQKPVYKSYKDLLRLDRPKKKIQYYSSDEQEDFLQKLLNEQKIRSKEKKGKKLRKSTGKTVNKSEKGQMPRGESRQKVGKSQSVTVKKQQNKRLSEIQLFLAQAKQNSKQDEQKQMKEQITQQKQVKPRPTKTAKSKSSTNIKIQSSTDKNKQLRKDMLVNNPIFIDTKSIEIVPILYSSANQMFETTIRSKQDRNAYHQLLAQKTQYQQQFKQNSDLNSQLVEKQIKHKISITGQETFSYSPNIKPLNSNWRFNLSMKPLQSVSKRQFPDRRTLFKNVEEQQRFLISLRQFPSSRR